MSLKVPAVPVMGDQPLRSMTWLQPVAQGYNSPLTALNSASKLDSDEFSLVVAGGIGEVHGVRDAPYLKLPPCF